MRSSVGRVTAAIALYASLAINLVSLAQYAVSMWQVAVEPGAQAQFINAGLDSYAAMDYLNRETPIDAKVICIGEPRTFYLDRGHMWGDLGSEPLYPPYDELGTAQALRSWLLARGYRYILINGNGAHLSASPGWVGMVYALTLGSSQQPLFRDGATVVYGI
jgi:hypothetical protein